MFRLLLMGDSHGGGVYNALVGPTPGSNLALTLPSGRMASNVVVVNETRGGETSATGLARVAPVVANGPYDAAIVCYGVNDLLGELFFHNMPAGSIAAAPGNVLAICTALANGGTPTSRCFAAAPPVGKIIAASTATVTQQQSADAITALYGMGHALRAAGHQMDWTMPQDADLYGATDFIHYSPKGYEHLAIKIVDFMRSKGVPV